jgi:hypothetical protein
MPGDADGCAVMVVSLAGQPPRSLLDRPLFQAHPDLAAAVRAGEVAAVVQLLRADPALVLRLARLVRLLSTAEVEAYAPTVRVLWAACDLYATRRWAVAGL